jgi:DNA-binding MarR family transcriptional regulator
MNKEIQAHAGIVVPILNELFENNHYDSLSPDELQQKSELSEQHLRRVIDTLLAGNWIEKARNSLSGYSVRLTMFGKREFDRQTQNHVNERIRQRLAAALAVKYEQNPHDLTDSDALVEELNLGRNAVCFNLLMMRNEGHVQLKSYAGAGHEAHTVRLTESGKAVFDNPQTQVLFISHAAVDKHIAAQLRQEFENAFPNIRVFVSSAPDALKPGDPWVQKILDALQVARAAIILTTDRGLTRYWVWYEAGAAWAKGIDTIFCCLGHQQKGNLPAPFSLSQAINLDDPADLEALFTKMSELFDLSQKPEFHELAKSFKSLNET